MKIPLSAPDVSLAEVEAVAEVLRSSRLSLAQSLKDLSTCSLRHRRQLRNCRPPLCMVAFGIRPGDEVIVPSFTLVAAANAIRFVGTSPVFVDIDPVTLNQDPDRAEAAITNKTSRSSSRES